MLLDFKKHSTITITADKIDITDPCYGADGWCRITKPITPGEYGCYYAIDKQNERVLSAMIILDSINPNIDKCNKYRVGSIGVDAGLAGFFENKPNYDVKEWSYFCDGLGYNERAYLSTPSNAGKCVGFFTSSGWGDGSYSVYKITHKRKHVGYIINF